MDNQCSSARNHQGLDDRPLDFVRERRNIYLGKKAEKSVEFFFLKLRVIQIQPKQ